MFQKNIENRSFENTHEWWKKIVKWALEVQSIRKRIFSYVGFSKFTNIREMMEGPSRDPQKEKQGGHEGPIITGIA